MIQGLLVFVVSFAVGALGSMLRIGGGALLIPMLTGLFDVPIKTAIGASLISVFATSSAAGTVYDVPDPEWSQIAPPLQLGTAGVFEG